MFFTKSLSRQRGRIAPAAQCRIIVMLFLAPLCRAL
jgi:hypothetical protein